MHQYDPYGIKHQQRVARSAMMLDLLCWVATLAAGVLLYCALPMVAEWMERQ